MRPPRPRATALIFSVALLLPAALAAEANELALPRAGDHALRVLSPTVLELEIVTQHGAPTPPLAGIVGEKFALSLPDPSAFAVTTGNGPVEVKSVGFKRRVRYAPLNKADIRVGNWLYLVLAQPLATGAKVEVRERAALPREAEAHEATAEPKSFWPEQFTFRATLEPHRPSPAIHVAQTGYAPSLPKIAMVGYYLGSLGELLIPSSDFELRETNSGKIVHRGKLARRVERGFTLAPPPYREVWQADFSRVETPGEYQLVVPGLGASPPFQIHPGAVMAVARAYALGFYHQRCGAANELPFTRHTHEACHIAPAEIPATAGQFPFTWKLIGDLAAEKRSGASTPARPFTADPASQLYPFAQSGPIDASGGHHDAGDYSKYTSNSAALVHHLVFAVDALAGLAELDNLGLPESGDGVPDILQIAKWEADFLAKLQDDDGGFYFLVYPRDRRYESNALPDAGEPQVVWPKNTAVTAAAVAALAQCASSPHFQKHFPHDAARYLAHAKRGWEFLTAALAQHGSDGAYQRLTHYGDNFMHDDEIAWAACELFLATGDAGFQRELFRWMPEPGQAKLRRWGWFRLSDGWGNAIRSYAFAARSGRRTRDELDARYLKLCETELLAAGDDALKRSQASAYGTAFPLETKRYRSGGWYFSLDFAMDLAVAWQIERRDDYVAALLGNLNYEVGVNPVNRSYLTGLGRERQREIVHQYSHNDRRALPPGGIPIGNIIAGQPYHNATKISLRELSYPDDGASSAPYAIYDRWSDAHNVSAEFIITNQARGLIGAAFLATFTPAARQPWRAGQAKIVGAKQEIPSGERMELRLELDSHLDEQAHPKIVGGALRPDPNVPMASQQSGRKAPPTAKALNGTTTALDVRDLRDADIIWEARDQEPQRGESFAFTPQRGGAHWVEAEAVWPDGRRVYAATEVQVTSLFHAILDDELPDGAAPSGNAKGWSWIEANPAPFSGTRALATGNGEPGTHELVFPKSSEPIAVNAGDILFAHVWIDPQHPPREIMIAWNDGSSWSHRAYWGENVLSYGKNETSAQWRMGDLPRLGEWVRLDVPAETVALAGQRVSGMSFSAVDGRVAWDFVGVRAKSAPTPQPRKESARSDATSLKTGPATRKP